MSTSDSSQPSSISAELSSTDADLAQALRQAAEAQVPPNIEGFQILRIISHGGQGIVYEAVQTATKRKVAIKVLLEGPHASPTARKRFEREIELVAQLRHPNIIAVFHSGRTVEGQLFCAMDYVRGLPLDRFVREQHIALEDALSTFATICDAVQHAHQRGIIHRDLKPANILVDADHQPRVLDFGLAKWLAAPVYTAISRSQQMIGTLQYMSPEQIRGNPDEIDSRADIYSLGVMLYLILTGEFPYPVAGQVADVLRHIAETPPTPPAQKWTPESGIRRRGHQPSRQESAKFRARRCPIDDDVRTIVLKTLAKERERRYQSAGELARDIRHYLAGEPIEAKRDSLVYMLRKKLLRHKAQLLAGLLSIIVVGAVTWGWLASRAAARAQLATQRAAWLATVRAERLRQQPLADPTDAARDALQGLWDLVAAEEAGPVERLELVSAALELELEERNWTRLADVARGDGDFLISYALHTGWIPPSYALEVHFEPVFDGQPAPGYDEPFLTRAAGSTGFWALVDELPVGSHVLGGLARVYFARLSAEREPGYELIDLLPVELNIGPFRFVVVDSYPADYPLEIVDPGYDARFAQEADVRLALVRSHRLHRGSSGVHDALRIELAFPPPPCELALRVHLSVPAIGCEESWLAALRPTPTSGKPRLLGCPQHLRAEGDAELWRLMIDLPTWRLVPRFTPENFRDLQVRVEIASSREAALQPDMNIEQYVRVAAVLSAVVGDERTATQCEAAASVYPRLEMFILPQQVRQALDADPSLSPEARVIAGEMLDDLDQPNVLMCQAREVVYRADATPAEYAAALLRAAAADAAEPNDGASLQVLGIAHYRSGNHEQAVETLNRSLAVKPFDNAVDLAFLAMALHRLDRPEEAQNALAQACEWLARAPHAPSFRRAFVEEAERLLQAEGP